MLEHLASCALNSVTLTGEQRVDDPKTDRSDILSGAVWTRLSWTGDLTHRLG